MKLNTPSNNKHYYSISIDPKEIGKGNERVGKGLDISIEGLNGNPEDNCSVFLEYYEGKVRLHVWTDDNRDPQTIILT